MNILGKTLIAASFVSSGILVAIVTTTTPSASGATGILAVFLLGYVVILCGLTFVVWGLAKITDAVLRRAHLSRRQYVLSLRKAYYYSSIIALAPIIIVSLQSVGGVGVYEVGLVVLFILLGCVYVSRRTT